MTKKGKSYQETIPTLHVTGRGEIQAAPEIARLTLSVITEGKTAQQAAASNAEQASRVIAGIREQGIAEDDVRTTGLFLYPVYRHAEGEAPEIVGYRAENSVEVRTDVARAGAVFDAGVAAGANAASSLTFELKNPQLHFQTALMAAVKAAKDNAEVASCIAGVELGGPIEITVLDEPEGPVFKSERMAAEAPQTPIIPGMLTVTARVRIDYQLV